MSENAHEQARQLIVLAGEDDISPTQASWLQVHLQGCDLCRTFAEAVEHTLSAIRSQPLAADFALVSETQLRVRSRAVELRQQQERRWLVCLSCLFVGLSSALMSALFWRACEWVGERAAANLFWETGFAFFWIAPTLVVSVLLLARGTHLSSDTEESGL